MQEKDQRNQHQNSAGQQQGQGQSRFQMPQDWDQHSKSLRQQHPQLTDEDLAYEEGGEEQLLGRVGSRLGKNRQETEELLGGRRYGQQGQQGQQQQNRQYEGSQQQNPQGQGGQNPQGRGGSQEYGRQGSQEGGTERQGGSGYGNPSKQGREEDIDA